MLKAPFPWFGGKSRVASIVWDRFGDVKNYVEPFAGSLACVLSRPDYHHWPRTETVNDKDCYLANFWRALNRKPDLVAMYADWPVNEADLHARHSWLIKQSDFQAKMKADPDYFCAKIAGWWVWGICMWIGGEWCRGHSWKSRPHLGRTKQCIPNLYGNSGATGRGINATRFNDKTGGIYSYFRALADRLRRVRVVCGDWKRVTGPSVTHLHGLTGMFLDPPYSGSCGRDRTIYSVEDLEVSADVRAYAIEASEIPNMRIALCGFEGEHAMPEDWECYHWKSPGGYAAAAGNHKNSYRERIWFSPSCSKPVDLLF